MQFPYGAVYFRKSNPPKQDWERDYRRAHEDGLNIFRHWFMWGTIEIAPGVYDWEDFDRQLELAEKYGIRTIIAEITRCIPEWVAARYPELLTVDENGQKRYPDMGVSCAVGGFGSGLCMDKPQSRELVQAFLEKLADRYRGHPALMGYDVVNETNSYGYCHCDDSIAAYRAWLRQKYGNIRALGEAWKRYSYTDFDEIRQPAALGLYPESVDWLDFNRERFQAEIAWVADVLRSRDPNALIVAHGVGSTLTLHERGCADDWKSAECVDVYGLTWVPCRHGNEPWRMLSAIDQTRSASRGKTFWHAEMQGGPLWLQPQVTGRSRNDGRIAAAEDVRIWNLMSMACGSRGILNPRFRPLLDGPLFGAFGAYGMDGERTDRSDMASSIAKWANDPAQQALIQSRPVRGDVGILYLPESSTASYLHTRFGNAHLYPDAMFGAYQAFLDNHIQADFVKLDQIDDVDVLYVPHPISMRAEQVQTLRAWVERGGVLICEACPAYWNEALHVDPVQPGYGAAELFGVAQKDVEFMPDVNRGLPMRILDCDLRAEGYLQTYSTGAAHAVGAYQGEVIAASNAVGSGRTLLIGANPSLSYGRLHDAETRAFFARLLGFAGKQPRIACDDPRALLRLSESEGRTYLWALNPTDEEIDIRVRVQDASGIGEVAWRGGAAAWVDGQLALRLPGRDGVIAQLI